MFSQVLPEPQLRISRRPKIETMYAFKEMPSPSTLFSTYASIATSVMLFRTMANELIPRSIRGYIFSAFASFFKHNSDKLTLVIEEQNGMSRNQLYDASETYLCTKMSPKAERLKISKSPKEKNLTIQFEKGEMIVDSYEGIDLKWRFLCAESNNNNGSSTNTNPPRSEKRYFELSFDKKNKGKVLCSYLNFVLTRAKAAKDEEKVLKIFTFGNGYPSGGWESINLEHPANFDTLAMDPDLKRAIVEDLDRFVRRKEFYKKVGRAWKRGYLLYGPPGTGKSSLIAAMANYLKFDVYDLQLGNLTRDSELRRLLLKTANKSILVIEDIDCSVDLPDRQRADGRKQPDVQRNNLMSLLPFKKLTLSGLLNFIDGLWSSCGDERIIVFTTNHKDRLDPALLRPGRMDVHIHMSYCTIQGFKLLASNYLGIPGHHRLYGEIESLFEDAKVTPAQVAEELMRSEDPEIALGGVIKMLKRKTMEGNEVEDDAAYGFEVDEPKRQKIENGSKGAARKLRKSG